MPGISILDRTSFASLEGPEQVAAVYRLHDEVYQKSQKIDLDNNELFRDRKLIAISYDFYSNKLAETNPFLFHKLKPERREALERDLLFAFYIMSAQYQLAAVLSLDESESRRENLRGYSNQIQKCSELIGKLRRHLPDTPERAHAERIEGHDHLAYLGLALVPHLAAGMDAIASGDPEAVEAWRGEGTTVRAKDSRNTINAPRLYWVWAGGWVSTWISLLSDSFARRQDALQTLSAITPITGFLSFGLYLTNAGIEIVMVAKHTLKCRWWMSEGEYELNVSWWQRLQAHADLRKYSILNDFIWGLGNLACYAWLTGNGMLGYYGNVATAGLLLMDVVLSGFAYFEEKKQYQSNIARYNRDIEKLQADIAAAGGNDKKILQEQLRTIEKAKALCDFEWTYKTYRLVKDWIYATALILAFVAMCCFLLPPTMAFAPLTTLFLSVGGTLLCFTASVINDAVGGYLDVLKAGASSRQAKADIIDLEKGLLKQFEKEPDQDVKKLLYIEMSQLRSEHEYQEELAHVQKMKVVYEVFLKLFVPPLVFSSFIFFPLGIGTAVLAVGFALAVQSGKLYVGDTPQKPALPSELNEAQFDLFAKNANRTFDDLPRFFTKTKKSDGGTLPTEDNSLDGTLPTAPAK